MFMNYIQSSRDRGNHQDINELVSLWDELVRQDEYTQLNNVQAKSLGTGNEKEVV